MGSSCADMRGGQEAHGKSPPASRDRAGDEGKRRGRRRAGGCKGSQQMCWLARSGRSWRASESIKEGAGEGQGDVLGRVPCRGWLGVLSAAATTCTMAGGGQAGPVATVQSLALDSL